MCVMGLRRTEHKMDADATIHHSLVNYILLLLQKCPISDIFVTFALFELHRGLTGGWLCRCRLQHHYLQITDRHLNDLFLYPSLYHCSLLTDPDSSQRVFHITKMLN